MNIGGTHVRWDNSLGRSIQLLAIGNPIAQPARSQQLPNQNIAAALLFFDFLAFWQANEPTGAFALRNTI